MTTSYNIRQTMEYVQYMKVRIVKFDSDSQELIFGVADTNTAASAASTQPSDQVNHQIFT